MADIAVQDLATIPSTVVDSSYFGLVFTSDGDTNKVVFEDAVSQANENNGNVVFKKATLTIASADVLTLNTTPLPIVSAVAGQAIEVVSANFTIDFNTTAYATNTLLMLITDGADVAQKGCDELSATVTRTVLIDDTTNPSPSNLQLISNAALNVSVLTGDPTAGDSDITLRVVYRLIPV